MYTFSICTHNAAVQMSGIVFSIQFFSADPNVHCHVLCFENHLVFSHVSRSESRVPGANIFQGGFYHFTP